jgi:glycerol-3-phosphate acyltransferase PlsY
MTVEAVLLVLGSYVWGSMPTAYLVGRWLGKKDIRHYGSGTVSGSMIYEHVSRPAAVAVGVFDLLKATLAAGLAMWLGMGLPVAAAAGLMATVGHNWPVFLRFTGGRGLGPIMGTLLVIFPWGFPWILAFLFVGWRLDDSAPWALASMITLPVFSALIGGPGVILPATGGMLLIMLAKRLEANRRPLPPPSPERRQVILLRLLFDRDIRNHREWIDRKPEATPPAEE